MLYGTVGQVYPDRLEELSSSALKDKDWRVRYQGAENLATVKTKTAVDALLELTGDGRPVVAKRAMTSLKELTGQGFNVAEQWQRWWTDQRAGFSFPEGREPGPDREPNRTVATFNNIVPVRLAVVRQGRLEPAEP